MTINPDPRWNRQQNEGVTPTGPGLRPFGAEPQDASQAKPLVPNAARPPLQPASGFINAIADRFQEAHTTPLSRDRALLLALTAMTDAESDLGPINHPDFDWSLDGARVIADENIEHWERPDAAA